jgi:hypothetical protein
MRFALLTPLRTRQRARALPAIVLLAIVAFAIVPAAVYASLPDPGPCNTCRRAPDFKATQPLIDAGRAVTLSGPIECPAGATVRLRADVSQLSGGAAEGFWSKRCTGALKHTWHTTATVTDGVGLSAGCARASGLAIFRRAGKPVFAYQWLRMITLIVAGKAGAAASC